MDYLQFIILFYFIRRIFNLIDASINRDRIQRISFVDFFAYLLSLVPNIQISIEDIKNDKSCEDGSCEIPTSDKQDHDVNNEDCVTFDDVANEDVIDGRDNYVRDVGLQSGTVDGQNMDNVINEAFDEMIKDINYAI